MNESEQKFAARFAAWQKAARERRGWNIPRLSDAIPYSDSQVRIFDADARGGFDATGKYRRPKREYVEAVAKATGADLEEGLVASQYRLPPVKQKEVRHSLTDEEWALIENYRGIKPDLRELYSKLIANSVPVDGKAPDPDDVPLVE